MRSADADGSGSVFGLSAPSISRRGRGRAALGSGFSGHLGAAAWRGAWPPAAPTHGIMAQGRWKTARMVEGLYARRRGGTRGEMVGVNLVFTR